MRITRVVRGLFMMAVLALGGAGAAGEQPEPGCVLQRAGVEYAYPRRSRDGSRILFQSNESGTWRICVMGADGSSVTPLTAGQVNDTFPDRSPDGSEICFVSDREGNEEIYVMKADGSEPRRLTDDVARAIHPYWTPGGKRILFNSTRGDGNLDVCSMNPDGSDQVTIVASGDNETCARLSPDGRRLVYLRNNDKGLDDVFLLDPEADEPRNLTDTPTRDGWPCWTPSGKGIVLSAMQDGRYTLVHLDIASGKLTQLTTPEPPAYDARAHVSADGRRIVLNRQVDGARNTIGIWTLAFDEPR